MNKVELEQLLKLHSKWVKSKKMADWKTFYDYSNEIGVDWMERSVTHELFLDANLFLVLLNNSKPMEAKE